MVYYMRRVRMCIGVFRVICAVFVHMGYTRKTRTCWAGCWRRWHGPCQCVLLLCRWDTRERQEHAGLGVEVLFVVTWSLSVCAVVVQMGYARKTRTCWAGCWRWWRCWTRTTPTVWPSMPGRTCAATGPTTPTLTSSSWKSQCSKYCFSHHLLLVPAPSVGLCPHWSAALKGRPRMYPPVWNLRAVIWFPFPISSLVFFFFLPSLALAVLSFLC